MREKLPKDGAKYQCCWEFLIPEPWRCPREAHEALDPKTFEEAKNAYQNVFLHGRALCEAHLVMLE